MSVVPVVLANLDLVRTEPAREHMGNLTSEAGVGAMSRAREPSLRDADPVEDLTTIVGRNLRKLRIRRGQSLERLAKRSGVSRAMLGQIETGKSAPTIGLLEKVAKALDVPIASLLQTDARRGPAVLRRSDAKLLTSSHGLFTSRALFPLDGNHGVEFYELRIAPLHCEVAEPHPPGTRENVFVAQGAVEIAAGSERAQILAEGDAILFDADVPHAYRNLEAREAVLYLVVTQVESRRP